MTCATVRDHGIADGGSGTSRPERCILREPWSLLPRSFGDGACGRGDAGVEMCARQATFCPGDHVQDAARRVGPSTPAHRFSRQDAGGSQGLQTPGRGCARDAMDS